MRVPLRRQVCLLFVALPMLGVPLIASAQDGDEDTCEEACATVDDELADLEDELEELCDQITAKEKDVAAKKKAADTHREKYKAAVEKWKGLSNPVAKRKARAKMVALIAPQLALDNAYLKAKKELEALEKKKADKEKEIADKKKEKDEVDDDCACEPPLL